MALSSGKKEAAKSDYVKYLKFNLANQAVGWAEKKWVWVPHKPEGFVAAEVLKDDGKKINVRLGTGEEVTMDTDKVSSMNPPKFDGSEDCLSCLTLTRRRCCTTCALATTTT